MLTIEAIQAAIPLSDQLTQRGIFLNPIQGEPLAQAVGVTVIDMNPFEVGTTQNKDLDTDIAPLDIEYSAKMTNFNDPSVGGSRHDIIVDEIIEVGSRSVTNHISFARNVVKPAVDEIVVAVKNQLANITPNEILGLEVSQLPIPSVLNDTGFKQSLNQYLDTPFEDPAMAMKLPNQTIEQILDFMKTGAKSLDDQIDMWAATKGSTFFEDTWAYVFQQKPVSVQNATEVHSLRRVFDDQECGIDKALMVYLICNRISENPPEGTEMTLDGFENLALAFRNQAGAKLVRFIDELDNAYKSGILIKGVVANCTVVYPDVYKTWIENGGDNDVLLGNMLAARRVYSVKALEEEAQSLKDVWTKHSLIVMKTQYNDRFVYVKKALRDAFYTQLANVGEEAEVNQKEMIKKIFDDELTLVTIEEIEDLYGLAMRLLCRSRFFKTDAERILTSIDTICKKNPTISVRESAMLATAELVADWLSCQFTPTAI